jgi:hypothetical protein
MLLPPITHRNAAHTTSSDHFPHPHPQRPLSGLVIPPPCAAFAWTLACDCCICDDFAGVSGPAPFTAGLEVSPKPDVTAPSGFAAGVGACCCRCCWLPIPGPVLSRPKSSEILDVGLRRGFSESRRVSGDDLGSTCWVIGDAFALALAFEEARAAALRGPDAGIVYGSLELDSYIPYEVTRRGRAGLTSLTSVRAPG